MLFAASLLLLLFGDPTSGPTSGPAVGEKLGDAKVKGVFEQNEAKEYNLLDRAKKEPTLLIFVHKFSRPTFRLLKEIDKAAAKHEGLNATFIWLSDDVEKTDAYLKRAKESLAFQTPVAISLDGITGPNGYGLNDQVDVTIVAVRDGKATGNFALVGPNETNAPRIVTAIDELMKKQ